MTSSRCWTATAGTMAQADVLGKFELAPDSAARSAHGGPPGLGAVSDRLSSSRANTRFIDCMSDAALARGVRPKSSSLRVALAELAPAPRKELLE